MVILMFKKAFTASEFLSYSPGIPFDLCSFFEVITTICECCLPFCLFVISLTPIRLSVLQTLIDIIRAIKYEQRVQSSYIYFHTIINTNMAVVRTFELRTTLPPFNSGRNYSVMEVKRNSSFYYGKNIVPY
jgi:hypothetical protein